MGLLSRLLIPRGVRRAVHPMRTVKRAATPKSIKKLQRSVHPVSNAVYGVERSLNTKKRRSRVRKPVWHHEGCTINHRTEDAANRCRVGRSKVEPARSPHGTPSNLPDQYTDTYSQSRVADARSEAAGAGAFSEAEGREIAKNGAKESGLFWAKVEDALIRCGWTGVASRGNRIVGTDPKGRKCLVFPDFQASPPCNVEAASVQYFAHSAHGEQVIVVTPGGFSDEAADAADSLGVELVSGNQLRSLIDELS